ncbi:hypothetical protein CDAR_317891 [Caerostris darwini]|uniref:Uncharacterized protein n=1 Tax=Caerostris darwini TaxID=1538125 RepID=A0AAV4WSL8_9ARAC|nr:hypothetical protein CDAR_317891 [Caerostris darwini]
MHSVCWGVKDIPQQQLSDHGAENHLFLKPFRHDFTNCLLSKTPPISVSAIHPSQERGRLACSENAFGERCIILREHAICRTKKNCIVRLECHLLFLTRPSSLASGKNEIMPSEILINMTQGGLDSTVLGLGQNLSSLRQP